REAFSLDLGRGLEAVSGGQDFDGDGFSDFAISDANTNFFVRSGKDGSLIFSGSGTDPSPMTVEFVGDFNNDGRSDLAVKKRDTGEGTARITIYSGVDHSIIELIDNSQGMGEVMVGKSNYKGSGKGALLMHTGSFALVDGSGNQIGSEAVGKVFLYVAK
ncbi:MAG: VCBS repeat-containing protein, partial [Bdellovibrionota bacterium]